MDLFASSTAGSQARGTTTPMGAFDVLSTCSCSSNAGSSNAAERRRSGNPSLHRSGPDVDRERRSPAGGRNVLASCSNPFRPCARRRGPRVDVQAFVDRAVARARAPRVRRRCSAAGAPGASSITRSVVHSAQRVTRRPRQGEPFASARARQARAVHSLWSGGRVLGARPCAAAHATRCSRRTALRGDPSQREQDA